MKKYTVKEVVSDICEDMLPDRIIIKSFLKVYIISGDVALKPIEWVDHKLLDRAVKRSYVGADDDGKYIKLILW